jgi:ribosomal protein S6--L-glutamate ligase
VAQERISVLVEARYRMQAQPAGLIAALERHGHRVSLIDPDEATREITGAPCFDALDLVVARGRSQSLLLKLKWAEYLGARTINRCASIDAVRDKAEMTVALAAAALPIPATFAGRLEQLTKAVPEGHYPVILKPLYGDNGRGLHIINHPKDWADVDWAEPSALVQRYLPSDGYDLKLYGIGEEVWAVRKPSPLTQQALRGQNAELIPVTHDMHAIGCRCRELFGLDLYGVDFVETPEGLVVIEVNDFPNYSAVPDADERLADFVGRCVSRRRGRAA